MMGGDFQRCVGDDRMLDGREQGAQEAGSNDYAGEAIVGQSEGPPRYLYEVQPARRRR